MKFYIKILLFDPVNELQLCGSLAYNIDSKPMCSFW